MIKRLMLLVLLSHFAGIVQADISTEKQQQYTSVFNKLFGLGKPSSITESVVPGFNEVSYGTSIVYISDDGKYVFVNGSIIESESRINLTKQSESKADKLHWTSRKAALQDLGEESMIVFKAPEEKHIVTVFTDVDCGYCRKLHAEMDQYLSAGISVRYLFFPRAGKNSQSYQTAVSIWCADDQKKSMTDAKANRPISKKTCDHPLGRHMELVRSFNLNGTPGIVLSSGQLLAGYVPAVKLSALLNSKTQ